MNVVDATDRGERQDEGESPSLLAIILDTNPHAWALLEDSLSLSKVIVNLLLFINAHLAINHANRVAVIASHSDCAEWLYPTPAKWSAEANGSEDVDMEDGHSNGTSGPAQVPDDANKYRPFAHIEHAFTTNLRRLMSSTSPTTLASTPTTKLAGALTRALAYILKQSAALPTANTSAQFNYSDPTSVAAGGNDASTSTSKKPSSASAALTSRLLLLSVSGDLANQYIPIMNAIFACQRLAIPIDICKLAGDAIFLQQAADATGGVYTFLDSPASRAGLLQYLMFAYLPDAAARQNLVLPGEGEGVDFRAACFCHRRVVEVGFVCSVCLSIFCEPVADGVCLTCGSLLGLGEYGRTPVVVARPKRKKRRGGAVGTPEGREGTPVGG